MGEKGNVTADELASAASAAAAAEGLGAVVAGAGTTVTAVFEETGETLKDKLIDKGTDAAIGHAQTRYEERRRDGRQVESGQADQDPETPPS